MDTHTLNVAQIRTSITCFACASGVLIAYIRSTTEFCLTNVCRRIERHIDNRINLIIQALTLIIYHEQACDLSQLSRVVSEYVWVPEHKHGGAIHASARARKLHLRHCRFVHTLDKLYSRAVKHRELAGPGLCTRNRPGHSHGCISNPQPQPSSGFIVQVTSMTFVARVYQGLIDFFLRQCKAHFWFEIVCIGDLDLK